MLDGLLFFIRAPSPFKCQQGQRIIPYYPCLRPLIADKGSLLLSVGVKAPERAWVMITGIYCAFFAIIFANSPIRVVRRSELTDPQVTYWSIK
jgi:hypothetical protein